MTSRRRFQIPSALQNARIGGLWLVALCLSTGIAFAQTSTPAATEQSRTSRANKNVCSTIHIVRPPSTTTTWPVIIDDPSARKQTASAMSSGTAARPIGVTCNDRATWSM